MIICSKEPFSYQNRFHYTVLYGSPEFRKRLSFILYTDSQKLL